MASVQGERAIRVFVSSTFRDMQAEREELVKHVFPRLRRLCEQRGVAWSEVDLRWGVTDEQKAEGAVLPICLAEIDRSRPYFLGLLGQRYGWVPEELPAGLTEQLPWLGSVQGTSVTELEVLHGVLNDPDAAGHAFFHLRDPAWLASRPAEEQRELGEHPSEDEVAALGPEAAERLAADRRRRLEELKARVRGSAHPCADYAEPAELGRQVLAELTALVDRLFPPDEVPEGPERLDAAHRSFGLARAAGSPERPALTARLDEAADGNGPPLVLRGAAGAELTPLVAAWCDGWRERHPGDLVVQHHAAATSDAASWKDLAARVTATAGSGPVPDDALGLRAALFGAFDRVAAEGRRMLLLVDGADLLLDEDGAPDLTWLPTVLPPAVRVVVTTAGDRAVVEALRRGWPVLEVPPLDEAERAAYVATYLARWAKGLDPQHVQALVSSPHTGDVLYLRTVLDELRQHGDHFTLGEVIAHYLTADSVPSLLDLVLERYEQDFERERRGLVGEAFRALWAARRGLTEPELLELLGEPGSPVPSAVWSPLVIAAETGLVTRSGLLAFATEAHRQAVVGRYLATADEQRAAHARLAGYFAGQPLGPRRVDELPWQQLAAGDVDGLVATLADLDHLALAYRRSHGDLRRLWARAEEHGRSVVEAYRPVLDDAGADPDRTWEVARLVTDAGHPAEALLLHQRLVDRHRREADPADPGSRPQRRLRASLLNLGAALSTQGELAEAVGVLEEAVERSRAADDRTVLGPALGNLGLCRRARGEVAAAVPLLREALELARDGDPAAVPAALGNLAGALRAQGDLVAALAVFEEQEELCRALGDRTGLGLALAGRAAVEGDRGDPLASLALLEAWRTEAAERGDLTGQVEALVSEAATLRQLGRHVDADARSSEAEAVARRLSDEPLLARVLDGRARSAIDEGRWDDARRLATEAVLTARSAGAGGALVLALGALGMAQRELGDVAGSRDSHREEHQVATAIGDPVAVATAELNLAADDLVEQDLASALRRFAAAEPVFRERGLAMALVPLLSNRWQVHAMLGDHAAAVADLVDCGAQCAACGAHEQRVQVLSKAAELMYQTGRMAECEPVWASLAGACAETGDEAGRQRALGEHALLLLGRGDQAGAAELLDRQEEICRRTGDQAGLSACLGNRAILQQQRGDLAGSLASLDEQLAVATAAGNGQGVLFATANRGEVLGQLGRTAEALAALEQARQMAAGWNLAPMVQQLDQMIAAVRARLS